MNWPFVSRRAHDNVANSLRRMIDTANREHDVTLGRMRELTEQRDYFRDRVEALTNDLLAMRRDGFSVAKSAKITEPVDEEAAALHKAEGLLVRGMKADDTHFIREATQRIMRDRGVSLAVAREEAIKLRRSITDEDAPV